MYLQSRFGRPQGKGTFGTDHPHSDLVLTSSPSQALFRCVTIPPLENRTAKSYHLGLCLNIDWKPLGTQGSILAGKLSGVMHMQILIKLQG